VSLVRSERKRDHLAVNADRSEGFRPGDEVVFIEDGAHAIVRWSEEGHCSANWLDEDPEESGALS
jgi:hypothetical protein